MRPADLKTFLTFAIANKLPVMIKGAPGIGKTDIVTSAAAEAGARCIVSHPVVNDPTDYKGLPFAGQDNTAHFMPFGELRELIDAKAPTVFFMDDLGQAPASVQAAVMQLVLARQINGHKVSDLVTFMAATNRREDKAGVGGILEPVKSRFASIVELDVNADDWYQWALGPGNMPAELVAFIRFRPSLLHKFEATKDITNTPCPRTVANVGRMQAAGLSKVIEFEAFKGAAGEAFAAEYVGFLKLWRELPNIDSVILNPKGAPLSTEPGVQYAMSGALAARMTGQNMEAICTYLDRMPAEFSVVCVKDAITRDNALTQTKEFIKLATSKKWSTLI